MSGRSLFNARNFGSAATARCLVSNEAANAYGTTLCLESSFIDDGGTGGSHHPDGLCQRANTFSPATGSSGMSGMLSVSSTFFRLFLPSSVMDKAIWPPPPTSQSPSTCFTFNQISPVQTFFFFKLLILSPSCTHRETETVRRFPLEIDTK
jgi:hypothetical protein